MRVKWSVFVVQLALITSQVHPHSAVSTETSEEYLRKVMIELQEMQQAMPTVPVYLGGNQQFLAGKRLLNTNVNSLRFPHQSQKLQAIEPLDAASNNNAQYYQVYCLLNDCSTKECNCFAIVHEPLAIGSDVIQRNCFLWDFLRYR